ncbi:MAG TPA: hypothetical protein VMS56_06860 [Thermoanaerobaculia bacterium]|nr:hypothetical protein [Thermoanaerobaculia bacterium]
MKRAAILLVLLATLSACSSGSRMPAGLIAPEIALAQIGDYSFNLQYRGPITISYQIAVANPSSEPIRLRQVKFSNVGTGAYYVRTEPQFFNRDIPPGQTLVATFSLPAFSQGGMTGSREPVTIRGIAYFDSEAGAFQKVFFSSFQGDSGRR